MKKNILIVIIFLIPFILFTQNKKKLDSLLLVYKNQSISIEKIKTAESIFINSRKANPQLPLEYLHKGLDFSKKLNFSEGIDKSYTNLALFYVNYHNLDSLRFYFSKAKKSCRGQ